MADVAGARPGALDRRSVSPRGDRTRPAVGRAARRSWRRRTRPHPCSVLPVTPPWRPPA